MHARVHQFTTVCIDVCAAVCSDARMSVKDGVIQVSSYAHAMYLRMRVLCHVRYQYLPVDVLCSVPVLKSRMAADQAARPRRRAHAHAPGLGLPCETKCQNNPTISTFFVPLMTFLVFDPALRCLTQLLAAVSGADGCLLRDQTGLVEKWSSSGVKWVVFFQVPSPKPPFPNPLFRWYARDPRP